MLLNEDSYNKNDNDEEDDEIKNSKQTPKVTIKHKNIIDLNSKINLHNRNCDEHEWETDFEILDDDYSSSCSSGSSSSEASHENDDECDTNESILEEKSKKTLNSTMKYNVYHPQKYVSFSPRNQDPRQKPTQRPKTPRLTTITAKNLTYPIKIRSNYEIYADRFDDQKPIQINGHSTHMNEYFRPVLAAKKLGSLKRVPAKLEQNRMDLLYNPIKINSQKNAQQQQQQQQSTDTPKISKLIQQQSVKKEIRSCHTHENYLPKIVHQSNTIKKQEHFNSKSLYNLNGDINDEINKLISYFPSIQSQRGSTKKLLQLRNYLNLNYIKYSTTYAPSHATHNHHHSHHYNNTSLSQYFASR